MFVEKVRDIVGVHPMGLESKGAPNSLPFNKGGYCKRDPTA